LTTREPAEAFVALLRLGALLSGWYMLAATGAAVVARAVGARSLIRLTDAASPPSVRAVVRWALGAGLAAPTALGSCPAHAAPARDVSAYWRALGEANRDLLADRSNPHLVFPGQVFRLPPPRP